MDKRERRIDDNGQQGLLAGNHINDQSRTIERPTLSRRAESHEKVFAVSSALPDSITIQDKGTEPARRMPRNDRQVDLDGFCGSTRALKGLTTSSTTYAEELTKLVESRRDAQALDGERRDDRPSKDTSRQSQRRRTSRLPHGNTTRGQVGQGFVSPRPREAPEPATNGNVDARINIHGDDGTIYQAPTFHQQHTVLRHLSIGQRVCFKTWIDDLGYWAYDVDVLQE